MSRPPFQPSVAPQTPGHAWEQNFARNMLFISHANPEDNTFTLWLALRLAREGYPVWCDLTKLLGGETFWSDIEKAIRDRTAKFLFVLSKNSNVKDGALNELDLALGVERQDKLADFVIPLRIDDLPFGNINIEIRRKNAIDYSQGWAEGLSKVLKKLAEDNVPKDSRFEPHALTQWWQSSHAGKDLLIEEPDRHLSNWFPIQSLPMGVFVHTLHPDADLRGSAWRLDQPAHRIGDHLVSFAPGSDFGGIVSKTHQIAMDHALASDEPDLPLNARQFRDSVVHLLRLAWNRAVAQRGLPVHSLSRRRVAYYFPNSAVQGSRVSFKLPDGFSGSRNLVGYKTVWSVAERKKVRRYWHYGVSADARLWPQPVLILNGHIFFSHDGETIWSSPKRLHAARRSVGSDWWNDDWRDRMIAAVSWLADSEKTIKLPVASNQFIHLGYAPVSFDATMSYSDAFARHAELGEVAFNDVEAIPDSDEGETSENVMADA